MSQPVAKIDSLVPLEGWVGTDPALSVIKVRHTGSVWEPLYAISHGEQRELPICFSLNDACIAALDAALEQKKEDLD